MAELVWTIPPGAGRAIVEKGALLARPLLGTDRFVRYAKDRGLQISRERLIRLERLRMFAPVFRVRTAVEAQGSMRIPADGGDNWFDRGWAQDTTAVPATYSVPEYSDRTHEAYYSVFQIYHLETVLSAFTLHVELDSYVDRDDSKPIDWAAAGARVGLAEKEVEGFRTHEYRHVVALLCQYVSNRYYPYARSDMRRSEEHNV